MAFLGLLHRRISFDFFLQFSWDAANPMMQRQQDPVECRQSSWIVAAWMFLYALRITGAVAKRPRLAGSHKP